MRFHESIFDVYFDDLDLFGILHNARYLLFMERALGEFWKKLGWGGFDRANPDQHHLVRKNEVEYLRPFAGVGELRVRLWVQHLGNSSCVIAYRVMPMDEDEPCAVGKRVIVCIDPDTRKSQPWSEVFRKKVAPYVQTPPSTE